MINYDDVTKENIKEHNLNWPRIPDYLHIILMIGGSWSGKTNALLQPIKQKDDDDCSIIDKTYLCLNILLKNVKKFSWKSERSRDFYWIFE